MDKEKYFQNPYCSEFITNVWDMKEKDDVFYIKLDRTYFFPQSHVFPQDKGTIGGIKVDKVFKDINGHIVHTIHDPLKQLLAEKCEIDYKHRFENMQQLMAMYILNHTLKDILCVEINDCTIHETHSVIEVKGALRQEDLILAEDYANNLISSGLEVKTMKDSQSITGHKVVVKGVFSAKWIGPTLKRTSEAGIVKILKFQDVGSSTYIHFVAGSRAISDYRNKSALSSKIIQVLSKEFPNESLKELKEIKSKLLSKNL